MYVFVYKILYVMYPDLVTRTTGQPDHRAGPSRSRGGYSNRLCTNTRDRSQELGQAVKAEIWKVKRSKASRKLEKVKGQAVKGQPDTKSHQSGQGPNSRSNILTAVAGVSTESIGVTSPCRS